MLGERKRVTVLFADIKGSTRLAEQVGAEVWHQVLDRFFGLLAAAAHRFEGTINQYTGDGVMALFGAPVAHEDHAQRACHAALEMQTSVRKFADELRLEHGLNLTLRIGLNTGEVIVGRIGDDLRMDYTAQGVTVNLASRLEQICEPGQVYLSRATGALVESEFALRSLGATRIKDVDEPMDVFALVGHEEKRSRLEWRLAHGSAFFLGRDAELGELQAAFARAAKGQGSAVGICGAAGIGKSRLCHEFVKWAQSRDVPVHRVAASPYARHQPMSALRTLYLSRIGCPPGSSPDFVRSRVASELPADLCERAGAFELACEFAGVGEKGELSEGIAASLREPLLRGLAKFLPQVDRPQILLIEDLHHLDVVALDFVVLLSAATQNMRSLLVLSWRSESPPEPMPDVERTVRLPMLDMESVTQLARSWLGSDKSVEALAPRIALRAAGNPFFVEEAVAELAEVGLLQGEVSAYHQTREISDLPIPDTVHALLASRIDRLKANQKRLLHAAAVIGNEFDEDLLAQIEPEVGELGAELDALRRAGFVSRLGQRQWQFVLPLTREVAYSSQLDSIRSLAHQSLALALIKRSSDAPATARDIAEHWALAGNWIMAGEWNLQAAQWFLMRDARLTAQHFLSAIRNLDKATKSEAVMRLGIVARAGLIRLAQVVAMDREHVDKCYSEAVAMTAEIGDRVFACELSISYGNALLQRGQTVESVDLIERGLRECPPDARAELGARFRMAVLIAFTSVGRGDEGLELINWASGAQWLSAEISSENMLSRAFVSVQLAWGGRLEQAERDLAKAIAQSELDGRNVSWMYGLIVDLAWLSGKLDGVMDASALAMQHAADFGSDYFRALALRARGAALILMGRSAEALIPLEEARPLISLQGSANQFEANTLAVLSEAYLGIGDLTAAERASRQAVESAQASKARLWELRSWMARLALPPSVLLDTEADMGLSRAKELMSMMQCRAIAPRIMEIEARRLGDPRLQILALKAAAQAYASIGASGHAERLAKIWA